MGLSEALVEVCELVDEKMAALLPVVDNSLESKLFEAMRYSVLSQGKRLRPFLSFVAASMFGVSRDSALRTAAAIEFIHTYSLIHDDLPALDNDDLRRGQPSCHAKFGEATAILAGDALLSLAFEILADPLTHPDPQVRCELITRLACASGASGMVGGQMMDLEAQNHNLSIPEITRMQRMKTGELFACACESGAILGKTSRNLRMALKGYAHAIGLAFQITDDLLDVEGTANDVGKKTNKDKDLNKATYISNLGIDAAKEQAKMLVNQALNYLEVFDEPANLLRQVAIYIINRKR
ncbi:MAG: polyprenyl synthetase family protein [Sphingobacteriia bacterium]|nr:polyprenyl synthetase family protein [Sphingobacteriia bacterium]